MPFKGRWLIPNSDDKRDQPKERLGGHGDLGLGLSRPRGFYYLDTWMAINMSEDEREGRRKQWIISEHSREVRVFYSPFGEALASTGGSETARPAPTSAVSCAAGPNAPWWQITALSQSWASDPFLWRAREGPLLSSNSFVWAAQGGTERWTRGLGYLLIGFPCLCDESRWFSLSRYPS